MVNYGQYNPSTVTSITGTSTHIADGINLDPEFVKRIDRIERMMENIAERLSILDDPSPERLERHKMLKEAYIKYKFLEELCGEDE